MGNVIPLRTNKSISPRNTDPDRVIHEGERGSKLCIQAVDDVAWLVLEQRIPLSTALKIMRLISR